MNYKRIILCISIIIILFIVIRCLCFQSNNLKKPQWKSSPHPSGKYGESSPGTRFWDVVQEFGPPSVYDSKPGGVAIWDLETLRSGGSCFDRIEIRDEMIPHGKPADHVDFLYTWYSLDVPRDQICEVIKLSDSVSYDPLKKLIRARCHDMRPNVVTLWIAKQMVERSINLEDAQAIYGNRINELFDDDPDRSKYYGYMKELCS